MIQLVVGHKYLVRYYFISNNSEMIYSKETP